ncbi:hypothetical protein ASD97_02560 [Streptomyces sp. Root63]|uniref:hypothetical protein n=1 Tax=unclassified Streptomyces TaxID=2593676 RepID=UPI000701BE42|nr:MULTISPECIES: hypothetical protein [unclassified Streptomyces]KQX28340.1 hypothetical protein ASD29_24510 [Streptomyces sp. Root1295]KRA49377.1 hypothetical protein ASD97_02560 [Streptomyces sp. Root63]
MTACAIEGGSAGAAATAEPEAESRTEPDPKEPGAVSGPEDYGAEPEPEGSGDPGKPAGADAPGLPGSAADEDGPEASSAAGGPAAPAGGVPLPGGFTLTADGAYAARLTAAPGPPGERAWYPERWTLDGPEPYAVPLPLGQPEEPDAQVAPLADGRVLIRRRVADRQMFSLLYPTGPGTGELLLGAVECAEMTLLPPSPDGRCVYALSAGEHSSSLWLVAGGAFGPEEVARIPGRCSGGAWLDRAGRMLALDRRAPGGGPVKAVAVDLGRGAEVTPLLQIAPGSDDRLLLADADSGLLLIRSDAPGHDRLGWGVLGSCLPVRFPECLRLADATVTPFAVQPGQMLMPESCAVALRIDGAAGSWVGVWRPAGRRLHQFAAPLGWAPGTGYWSRDGVLRLPYTNGATSCGVALLAAPQDVEPSSVTGRPGDAEGGTQPSAAVSAPAVCRPVPLGQAPLHRAARSD